MPHTQTWVKVNAPVDEGVAELVSALSQIDGLETLESCQGYPGRSNAFVLFRFGTWQECGELMFARILPLLSPDLRASTSLRLQAYDTDHAIGRLDVDPAAVPALAGCIRECAKAGAHRSGCSRGK